ncbi:MAG: hypothetical protein AAF267_03205 [Deinococcota bacterium]
MPKNTSPEARAAYQQAYARELVDLMNLMDKPLPSPEDVKLWMSFSTPLKDLIRRECQGGNVLKSLEWSDHFTVPNQRYGKLAWMHYRVITNHEGYAGIQYLPHRSPKAWYHAVFVDELENCHLLSPLTQRSTS